MLIVFAGAPAAAPGKAMFKEKPVSQIFFVDLIGKVLCSVGIGFASGRSDVDGAVFFGGDIRVIKRIQINGKAVGVVGELTRRESSVIEAGGVVILDRKSVV